MTTEPNIELCCSRRQRISWSGKVLNSLKGISKKLGAMVFRGKKPSDLPVHDGRAMRDIGLSPDVHHLPHVQNQAKMQRKNVYELTAMRGRG